jgi:hypothetical protein
MKSQCYFLHSLGQKRTSFVGGRPAILWIGFGFVDQLLYDGTK